MQLAITSSKCRTALKELFVYLNLNLSEDYELDSLSCLFTSMSFLNKLLYNYMYINELFKTQSELPNNIKAK